MTSHERTLGVARAWAQCAGLTARDRYLVVNPFFHTFGYKAGILACLVSGAALVPQAVFDAGQAMRLIEAERITVLPGAPTCTSPSWTILRAAPSTCPACGWRSPGRRTCRSRWSSGCGASWASRWCSPRTG